MFTSGCGRAIAQPATRGYSWFGTERSVGNTANVLIRLRTPEEIRGRAYAAAVSMVIGASLLGTATAGVLLLVMGLRAMFSLVGSAPAGFFSR